MNFVDRLFLVIVLGFTVLLLNSGYNLLDLFSLADFVLILVVVIVVWEMGSVSFDRILGFVFDKEEVVVNKSIDIVPLIKTVRENEDLREFKAESVEESIDKM